MGAFQMLIVESRTSKIISFHIFMKFVETNFDSNLLQIVNCSYTIQPACDIGTSAACFY